MKPNWTRTVGDKVKLTAESFQNVVNSNRWIYAYPCDSFVESLRAYIGQEATVTHTFPPGYDITIRFKDGHSFHSKHHWVESV